MRLAQRVSALLFPQARCLCCDEPRLLDAGQPLCAGCQAALMEARIGDLTCPRCLSFLSQGRVCSFCAQGGLAGIDRAYAPFSYRDEARQLVVRLKFGPCQEAGPPLARAMAQAITGQAFDYLVPVPLHRLDHRARGFNQAELLSQLLQRQRPDLPLLCALEKHVKTQRQSSLNLEARLENARGKFRAIADVKGKAILLVDDVRTTGSTVQECAGVLRAAGATSVSLLTATVA